jgi:uncharacterized protein (DUF302 family)
MAHNSGDDFMKRRSTIAATAAALCAFPATAALAASSGAALDASVLRMKLQKGITPDVAVDCLKLRANLRNMKQVGYLPLSKQVEAMVGKPQKLTEVFLFCNPLIAIEMVAANIDFAAYLPCRITLTEDSEGSYWLVMLNLAPLIAQIPTGSALHAKAESVNDILMSIMHAGAYGEL